MLVYSSLSFLLLCSLMNLKSLFLASYASSPNCPLGKIPFPKKNKKYTGVTRGLNFFLFIIAQYMN
jgi:hypothetical protein